MFINNLAYEASAGSGKTFMLVVRYLSLLFQGADPSKILALTFTNKAASEMSERIVETLESLDERDELAEIIKVTELSKEDILAQRTKVLQNFLNASTKIMTIDSFFTQILRKFSLYVGLMPDFTTHATQHEMKLLERFLREVSVANEKQNLLHLALESKKRVGDIFSLLEQLYEKQEELEHLQLQTTPLEPFKKDALEALALLQNLVAGCKGASASLQKAVACESFEALLEKTWVYKESLEYWVFKKCFSLDMNRALHQIQEAIYGYYRAKEQNFFSALFTLVGLYVKAKKALYTQEGELGFSDVTQLVYTILHKIDESEFLYFRLDAKIEHILLDEFQDTSLLQYKILRPLIEEITSGEGIFKDGSFFFVGDVKQSIYRFRGGVSALFGEVAKEQHTQVEKLRVNYRSQKEVVEFVNHVFQDKIKNYTQQEVRKGADGGYVEVVVVDTLLETLTQKVLMLLQEGAFADDIAILCATNGDGEEIKNRLTSQAIEVVTETTTKLIEQKSVQAVLEYLKYLYFQEDIYKKNFFALIECEEEPLGYVDFTTTALLDVVKKVVDRFGLFHNDFHLVRFFDALANYKDVESLLFEYERLDTSAAARDLKGVRILTIHKSKGLEFKHVLVVDRLKKEPPTRNAIIYEYDGIVLQNIYLRTKSRELIDKGYENALLKEKALVQEDKLNAHYVAFTRAREHLFVLQKTEKSSFEALQLREGTYGELRVVKQDVAPPKQYEPFVYEELYYGSQSEILRMPKETEADLESIYFGLAMHYMLEMMGEFSLEYIDDAQAMMLNKYGFVLKDDEVDEIVLRVRRLMQEGTFLALVEGRVAKEKPLRYKKELRYLDLLVEKEDGSFVVIDYKSGVREHQSHQKQVAFYLKAVQQITQAKVQGFLCYLLHDKIVFEEV
jgi:exodeoxyribonuclease V beta subunit